MLRPCSLLADVATDHGLLAAAAVSCDIAERAVATDLREAPLLRARDEIEHQDLEERITLRRGDGLAPLLDLPVDALVIAGISGELMARMLESAPQVVEKLQQIVLQPNKDSELVRAWAYGHGWHLQDEQMVEQKERTYSVMAWKRGQGEDPAYAHPHLSLSAQMLLGPLMVERRDNVSQAYFHEQAARLAAALASGGEAQRQQLEWYRAALKQL